MAKLTWLLVTAIALAHACEAYRILVVFPVAAKSHSILGNGVVKYLLEAGHEVTYITPFPDRNPPHNLHLVDSSGSTLMSQISQMLNISALLEGTTDISSTSFIKFIKIMTNDTLTNPNFARLMSDTSKSFDVVIADWLFSDIYAGIAYLYNCPLIWLSTIEPHWTILSLIDEATNPAYVPDSHSSNVPPFNFYTRVEELVTQVTSMALRYIYVDTFTSEQFDKLIGPHLIKRGRPMIPFKDIKYNASLVLGNSHVSLGQATRLPQAYKPIGGYHIDAVVKPLPNDLKNLLDNSRNGLIYFSMGSNLKSKDLPEVLKKDLLQVFGGLKQTVLWKFEEKLLNLPSNVYIVDWAPQQSILAHPNCVLFITHGGLLSTTEAVHFGKPIIGIPVFADQFNNIDRAVKKGFALRVDLAYDMKDKLRAALDDLLHDRKYTQKARELSFIYHDRPVHPGKELVHWVEHVVKTKGALHLRSPALDVPFYQKMYLDLLALVFIVLYILKKIVVWMCCSKKIVEKKRKKN